MFKKITSLFSNKTKDSSQIVIKKDNIEYRKLIKEVISEIKSQNPNYSGYFYIYGVKFSDLKSYHKIKAKKIEEKKAFALWLMEDLARIYRRNGNKQSYQLKYESENFECEQALLPLLFRSNLDLEVTDYKYCFTFFKDHILGYRGFEFWPVGFLVQQLERKIKKEGLDEELKFFLDKVIQWKVMKTNKNYYGSDIAKVRKKLENILYKTNPNATTPTFVFTKDDYGKAANIILEGQKLKNKDALNQILHLSYKVTTGKPTKKFLKETSTIIDNIGFKDYKEFCYKLFEEVIASTPIEKIVTHSYGRETYDYSYYEFIEKNNLNTLKGLVWTMSKFHDSKSIQLISKLADRCFYKIPGIGATAQALGNACLFTLANSKGKEGIAQLTVIQQKVKHTSTKKLIDKYIEEISEKLGITKSDIEESIVSEFGLKEGKKEVQFVDYSLKINVEKIGKVNLIWVRPDGKTQKTTPNFVKNSKVLSEKLKKTKSEIKEIQKFLVSQRNRLDNLLIEERVIPYKDFQQYYLDHGLISFLAKRLIWIISSKSRKGIYYYFENKWISLDDDDTNWIDDSCSFQLWHPIYADTKQVLNWRNFLIDNKIVQPLKQAFREIYLLTEAEINTQFYSNRMASHLIKQHQFNMLAKLRNWNYQLVGAWDHGSDCKARRSIKVNKDIYEVEFWLNELFDDGQINDTGIYLYMSTDQVRYSKNGHQINLIDVPEIIFSETMRDVDLFVGVCSVGNDPEWSDNGGLPQYRDYWQSYSFGDLTEVAKTRKTILKNLVPRLKIKNVAKIEGKFLIVEGKLRTYKIHIGSTNILMTPNDQYLCIVPSGKNNKTDNLYLPFEGDRGLSVILSKAFLLAEDTKIRDSSITSQIIR